jgi:hypothetical protein
MPQILADHAQICFVLTPGDGVKDGQDFEYGMGFDAGNAAAWGKCQILSSLHRKVQA